MRVLHVEDNPVDADLAARALRRAVPDLALTQVATLAEARARIDEGGVFDAALIDLNLPDGSGFELLVWIRSRVLPIAVIMLTGSGDQQAAVSALQAGADDYLTKGSDSAEQLAATMQSACSRSQRSRTFCAQRLRVLYAEHTAADIELTRRHLARAAPHIELTVVEDAASVLDLLPSNGAQPADFDVVLLDYRLPGLDALDVVKIVRTFRGLDIPIVMVTGQGTEAVAAQAIRLGVDDYIFKHASYLHELPATLDKVHRQAELARERMSLRETSKRLGHVLATSPVVLYTLRKRAGEVTCTWVSGNIAQRMGFTPEQAMVPGWWQTHVHPEDRDAASAALAVSPGEGQIAHEYRFFDGNGRMCWIRDELRCAASETPGCEELIGAWQDVTARKLADQLRETRVAVLDGLMAKRSLESILLQIATRLERIKPETRVSVLLRDPLTGLLNTVAAPSLPDFYNDAVNALEPSVGRGSCGTSAAIGEPVIVGDIRTHPYWADYLVVTEPAGLRACWSIPFKDEAGRVLGTFGIYYDEPRSPTQDELDLIGEFARLGGLAVERARTDASLRQAAAVLQSTREGVVITDLQARIVAVNPAYSRITGYPQAEALGSNPRILQSGRQDRAFYEAMWSSITETGHWQGEIWNRRKDGVLYPQLLTISTVLDAEGLPCNYVGVMTDISQLKDSQARLEHLAHYDPLTALPNRLLLQSRLEHALESAQRHECSVGVLYIDLDRFKNVNDSLGHPVGDELLGALARRLHERVRDEDTLGRLGGDEFLLILENLRRSDDAARVARELLELLDKPFELPSGHQVYMGASIGISMYPDNGQTGTELIQHADVAVYQAKESGRNTFSFYTPALTRAADERLALEAALRRALAQGEFVLHFQPQIDLASGRMLGCESLVRWDDPNNGLIAPQRFIPLAEETGLIVPLGEWVLHEACRHAREWMDAGHEDLVMAVNLSARQLLQPDIVERITATLATTGLPAANLRLELTESMIMGHGEEAIALLGALKGLGVGLSIDDFGTGYSSLAYLKRFPIDELKIDRSFVRDIPHDSVDMEIAAAIISMARSLRLKVVAEGVETEAQRNFLRHQGCHACQGYLFSPPVPARIFGELLGCEAQG